MWIDPVNRVSVVAMVQFFPFGAVSVYGDVRRSAYVDLRVSGAVKA